MKYYLITILVVAQFFSIELFAGRYAGDFMMIGSGVKPLGMGGAFSAVADDGNAIYWNPSGISQIRNSELTIMRAFLYNSLAYYDNISFCQPLPNEVTIGLNLTRLTIDDIPFYNEQDLIGLNVDERINNSLYHLSGTPEKYFKSTDDLIQFAFSKHLQYMVNMGWLFFEVPVDVYLGSNIKYIKRQIDNRIGTGTGFDASFLIKSDLAILFDYDRLGTISFGANFQDIAGTEITWGETDNFHKDEVLFNSKIGVALTQPIETLNSKLIVAFDTDYVYSRTNHFGIDWDYNSKGNLRFGLYDDNLCTGASVNVYGVFLDYALITNPLGLTNRVGLRFKF
jgi:hypothetical protein